METLEDTFSKVNNMADTLSKIHDLPNLITTAKIDEKDTTYYKTQQQTNKIIEHLINNYNTLTELYELKKCELKEAKTEARKAKRYNVVMLILTVISMLVAIASWLCQIF